MAAYSGTAAARIVDIQNAWLKTQSSKDELVEAAIKDELGAAFQQGAKDANEAVTRVIKEREQQLHTQSKKLADKEPNKNANTLIGEMNKLSGSEKIEMREKVHAKLYQEAVANFNPQQPTSVKQLFLDDLDKRRRIGQIPDREKSELEKVIIALIENEKLPNQGVKSQLKEIADKMTGSLKEITDNIAKLSDQEITLLATSTTSSPRKINFLTTKTWQSGVDDEKAKNTTQPANQTLLDSLIHQLNTAKISGQAEQPLREQIHAVVYSMSEEESKSTSKSPENIFAEKLDELRKARKLDGESTELEKLVREKKYDALAFMEKAINEEQKLHPHDTNKTPNVLEQVHAKLMALNKKIEQLQKKAGNTTNPLERDKLALEAHSVLRLHGEMADILNRNQIREDLQGMLDKQGNAELIDYLTALEAQQQALIKIAGKDRTRYTPIPLDIFKIPDNDHTAMIIKRGNVYGNVSYKEKDENGHWEPKTLQGKNGPVTGLTRTEIMAAILKAQDIIRKGPPADPTYTIKITEDSDGTIHYDTGNRKNREVLHGQFVNTFDNKLDAQAAASSTSVAYQQTSPAPQSTTITHSDGSTADSSPPRDKSTIITHTSSPPRAT